MDFHKLFNHIPETIIVISPDFEILAATNAYLSATMRTRDELIGKHMLEEFPDNPENESSRNENKLRDSLNKVLETKKPDYFGVTRYDIPRPAAQGGGFDIRFWEARHTPVLNTDGSVAYIIQNTNDVTEREIAKLELSESENKFRFMADSIPQLIDTNNADGVSTYFNQRWVEYTGIPVKELLDGAWQKAIHPDDLPNALAKYDEAFSTATSSQTEIRIKNREGRYRWHINRYQPMQDENGEIVMWIGSCTDIHDTRKLVQELLESNEQMSALSDQLQDAFQKAESERYTIENMFMNAPAIFCTLQGPEHRFDLVNKNYQDLFPHRQLIGKTVAEALPEVVEQGFIQILDDVYTTGKEFVAEDVMLKIERQPNQEPIDTYLNFIYQPIYTKNKITGILVFGYEVTEKFRFKEKLKELGHAI